MLKNHLFTDKKKIDFNYIALYHSLQHKAVRAFRLSCLKASKVGEIINFNLIYNSLKKTVL